MYDVYHEFAIEESRKRLYEALLRAHPDCRDPDHPGCEYCEEDDVVICPMDNIIE